MGQLGVHPALGASCTPKPKSEFICTAGPWSSGCCFLTPEASVCLSNLAQAAPWNSIIPPCKADLSVIGGNQIIWQITEQGICGVPVTLVSHEINSVMSPCRKVLLRHLIQQKRGWYEITLWMLGMIWSEQAGPVLDQRFYPLRLYWFWSSSVKFKARFTVLSSHKLQNLSLIEV